MTDVFDLDFVFVVGKGGVGKTTVSAALALAAARRGKRVLVAMCNARERLSYLLDSAPIGPQVTEVVPGVDAVNMLPRLALEEYGQMVLKVRALYKAIFDNRFVAAFLRGTPGLEAWSMLGKAYYHTKELDKAGRRRYDMVIVDAPATGHGLDMLRVPQVLVDVAPPGLLRREAEAALSLFRDPARAGVLLVTLPEEMPVAETLELHTTLRDELHLPVSRLVVNGVFPSLFEPALRDTYASLRDQLAADSPLRSLAVATRSRAVREQLQEDCMRSLGASIAEPRVELPRLFGHEFRRPAVEALSFAIR